MWLVIKYMLCPHIQWTLASLIPVYMLIDDYMKHICLGFFSCVILQASDTSVSTWQLIVESKFCT